MLKKIVLHPRAWKLLCEANYHHYYEAIELAQARKGIHPHFAKTIKTIFLDQYGKPFILATYNFEQDTWMASLAVPNEIRTQYTAVNLATEWLETHGGGPGVTEMMYSLKIITNPNWYHELERVRNHFSDLISDNTSLATFGTVQNQNPNTMQFVLPEGNLFVNQAPPSTSSMNTQPMDSATESISEHPSLTACSERGTNGWPSNQSKISHRTNGPSQQQHPWDNVDPHAPNIEVQSEKFTLTMPPSQPEQSSLQDSTDTTMQQTPQFGGQRPSILPSFPNQNNLTINQQNPHYRNQQTRPAFGKPTGNSQFGTDNNAH